MSTKIHEAVRVPIDRLNEYISLCNIETLDDFHTRANRHLAYLSTENWRKSVREVRGSKYVLKVTGRQIRLHAVQYLTEAYTKASLNMERDFFCVDSGLNIWLNGYYAYIIPFGGAKLVQCDFEQDYHYQNQTDKPDDIPDEEWDARERKWEEVCLNDWNATRLYHAIVSFAPGEYSSLFDLELYFGLHPGVPGNNTNWKSHRRTERSSSE